MSRRGILLAGGAGTRLRPLTLTTSKHLLPVHDRPMIHYPLSTLIAAGVREVLVITAPEHGATYRDALGDGARWGISLTYAEQPTPAGIPQACLIGREFTGGEPSVLILGDNIFVGEGMGAVLARAAAVRVGATIVGCRVDDARRYGVAELAADGRVVSIEEKPVAPRSAIAVTGLYFLDGDAPAIAERLRPSRRGETEITDLLRAYLRRGHLRMELLGEGAAWCDAGTHQSLHAATELVRAEEARTGRRSYD